MNEIFIENEEKSTMNLDAYMIETYLIEFNATLTLTQPHNVIIEFSFNPSMVTLIRINTHIGPLQLRLRL